MTARKSRGRQSRSQLVNYLRDSYFDRTSRPIYALAYLLGFLVLYEFGTILINPESLTQSLSGLQNRVVAFLWVQELLGLAGFRGRLLWVATPLVVIIILLALQFTSRTRWTVNVKDFVPMTVECIALTVPLLVLSLLVNTKPVSKPTAAASVQAGPVVLAASGASEAHAPVAGQEPVTPLEVAVVTGIGAGIYEELVFRLILICLLMMLFQDLLGLNRSYSILFSVVISAVAFSAHHHVLFLGGRFGALEPFQWQPFIFRMLAGAYFAMLFAFRGFGITAGTHAFYDIIAAVLKTVFLAPPA